VTLTILWLILIGLLTWIVILFVAAWIGSPRIYRLQSDVDLRLTYKRYMEIYPSANMSYEEYKRLQVQKAYRRAVSSTKIKRMVR
jgi:hypothetical protein